MNARLYDDLFGMYLAWNKARHDLRTILTTSLTVLQTVDLPAFADGIICIVTLLSFLFLLGAMMYEGAIKLVRTLWCEAPLENIIEFCGALYFEHAFPTTKQLPIVWSLLKVQTESKGWSLWLEMLNSLVCQSVHLLLS